MVYHNLAREAEDMQSRVPVTARACRWNNPGAWEAYDITKPLAFMPFTKDDPNRPVKRHSTQLSELAERMLWNAYSMCDRANNIRDNVVRTEMRAKLFAIIRRDLKCASAAEVQWGA